MVLFRNLDIPQDLKDVQNSLEMSMKDIDMSRRKLFCRSIAIIELVLCKYKLFKIDINKFYACVFWIESWNAAENKGGS
jgi:hypothetical protein